MFNWSSFAELSLPKSEFVEHVFREQTPFLLLRELRQSTELVYVLSKQVVKVI